MGLAMKHSINSGVIGGNKGINGDFSNRQRERDGMRRLWGNKLSELTRILNSDADRMISSSP